MRLLSSPQVAARCPSQRTSCLSRHREAGFRSPDGVPRDSVRNRLAEIVRLSPSTRHEAGGPCEMAVRPPRVDHAPVCLSGAPPPEIPLASTPPSVHRWWKVRSPAWRPGLSFRPCGTWPTSTVFSAKGVRACCIPSPDMGFAGFPPDTSWLSCDNVGEVRLSRQRSTLRRFAPRRQPFPVARVCSPLTVLSEDSPPRWCALTVTNPVFRSRGCPLLRVAGHDEDRDEHALGHFLPPASYEPR